MSGKSDWKWDPFRIVFVCTGNVCRSALAERLGRAFLDEVLGRKAAWIRLERLGVRALVGAGTNHDGRLVLERPGGGAPRREARGWEPGVGRQADPGLART